jgi:hypothetical protein
VSILLDAGPSLNFLAVGQQNILIQVAASRSLQLAAPQRVDTEVEGMTKDLASSGPPLSAPGGSSRCPAVC